MTREQYILNCLAEECAEVGQRASKAIRFGMTERQPGQELDNRKRLEQELGDLMGVVDLLGLTPCPEKRAGKEARVLHYMDYSAKCGRVDPHKA